MPYKSYKNISLERDDKLLGILGHIYGPDLAYEKRRVIHAFRRCLTPKGFEKYVERFYALHRGYGTNMKRRADDSKRITDDHGVDIEGTKQDAEGNGKGVFVQCKRYSGVKTGKFSGIVGRNDIAVFVGNSKSPDNRRNWPVELVFATTSYLEKKAAAEAKAQKITVIDCVELARMDSEEYPLSHFIKDLLTKGKEGDRGLFLDWEYVQAYFDVRRYVTESVTLVGETRQRLEELKVELKAFIKSESGIENPIIEGRYERPSDRNFGDSAFEKLGKSYVRYEDADDDSETSRIDFGSLIGLGIAAIVAFWMIFFVINAKPEKQLPITNFQSETVRDAIGAEQNAVVSTPEKEKRRKNIPSKRTTDSKITNETMSE